MCVGSILRWLRADCTTNANLVLMAQVWYPLRARGTATEATRLDTEQDRHRHRHRESPPPCIRYMQRKAHTSKTRTHAQMHAFTPGHQGRPSRRHRYRQAAAPSLPPTCTHNTHTTHTQRSRRHPHRKSSAASPRRYTPKPKTRNPKKRQQPAATRPRLAPSLRCYLSRSRARARSL